MVSKFHKSRHVNACSHSARNAFIPRPKRPMSNRPLVEETTVPKAIRYLNYSFHKRIFAIHMRKVSDENLQGGFSHGFVVEFENEEDREYYLNKDPEHLAFVDYVKQLVQNIRVVDFEPGKF
jgi:predicted GNAT superfamily acetyltransferase